MKKFNFRMLLVLIGVLITSLTTPIGAVTVNGGKFYFDATNFSTTTVVQFAFIKCGDSPYSEYCGMSQVTNTKLYYYNRTSSWGGLWYIAVIGNGSSWTSGSHCANVGDASSYTNTYNANYTFNNGSEYYLYTASNTAGDLTPSNGVPSTTQTVITYLNGSIASTSPARIKIDSYYKSGDGTGCATNSVVTTNRGGSNTSTYDCIITAKTTLKVDDVASGVTFVGWYKTDGTLLSSNANYTYYGSTDNTIHARFENRYSITVNAGSNGTITTPAGGSGYTVTAGYYTSAAIAASANNGYYFTDWNKSNNKVTITSTSSASTSVTATGTATVTANFAARWVLRGSKDDAPTNTAAGMPGWSPTTSNMTAGSTTTKDVTLWPNTHYKYRIYDPKTSTACGASGDTDQTLGSAWTLNGSNDAHFMTQGYGTYRFSVTVGAGDKPSVTVSPQFTSYAITMGVKTWTDGTGSVGTGGTNTAKTTEAATDFAITTGKYIRSGGTATFTATPNSGYQFMGWFNSSSYNPATQEPISTSNPLIEENITAATTRYALFKEITYDVTVSQNGSTTTTKKVGIVSHPSITAVAPSGKVFDRWVTTGSARVASTSSSTTTITSASDNQSTVIATFKDLPKIYYCKEVTTAGWTPSDMYVYFYKTGGYWDNTSGSGSSGDQLISGPHKMTKIAGKNIWYYEYNPNAGSFAGKTIAAVSFMDKSQTQAHFSSCSGTYRSDFSSCMNMFVLTSASGETKNSSAYYRNTGYWRNYEEVNSGYYLNNLPCGSTEFTDEDGNGVFETIVNLDKNTTYYFYVGGCNGWNWSNNNSTYPFNTSNRTRTLTKYDNVASDSYRCKLTTTEAGYYTFKLTPSNTAASLSVTVDFPINTNDYHATVTIGGKKFPSNIIKSGESSGTISLWLANGSNTIAIEKYNGSAWANQVSRTVSTSKAGVYTMTLTCNGASSTLSVPEAYTGNYYIRTDCAPGGWQDYKDNKLTENTLTFSESDAKTFNYYYCKWVSNSGTNVRFVVANDINMAISDTLKHDAALGNGSEETLPAAANVRFAYNSYTNGLSRAYISGSTTISDRFLVMKGDSKMFNSSGQALTSAGGGKVSGLNDYEMNFVDKNNWVYQADVTAQSGSQVYLVARYNGSDRNLFGSSSSKETLITSTNGSTKYHLTTIYDFKTNNLMTAWKPGADAITETISDVRSVMLVRSHHGGADQITVGGGGSIASTTIYGVMQFNKYTLNNQSTAAGHATLVPPLSEAERNIYWISFPFDVRLKEVFGFGSYYRHWGIEYYDGAERAEKGYWVDSDGFWKLVTPAEVESGGDDGQGFILKKNVGYLLVLDLDLLGTASSIWDNNVTDVALYFPSKDLETITGSRPTDVEVPEHNCTIDRRSDADKENNVQNINKDRRIADSHWNVIGVPSYSNVVHLDSVGEVRVKDKNGDYFTEEYPEGFGFYYAWVPSTATYDVTAKSTETTFKTMHAYMLQFAGIINWSTQKASLFSAPARYNSRGDYDVHLELRQGNVKVDQTFVRFSEKEDVTANYEFSQDITKIMNANKANIYTLIEGYIPAGGNSMPYSETTTIVPVGVKIASNTEYTFTIPEGTSGVGVTLIDNETGERTNLGLTDYTISLEAGTYDERFALEISPIKQTPTDIDLLNGENGANGVRKVMCDGVLYIVKDGEVFDARGNRVH